MVPGEMTPGREEIIINEGRNTCTLKVTNTGDRAIQVGSHFHFFEVNKALKFDREKAYDMVQKLTAKSWNEQKQFKPLVENSEIMNYLSKEDIDDAFDYHYHLRHVDDIFKKLGLDD